ncbi:MAG: hypothetical protein WD273_04145 [Trueperaceae bacterium]
MWQIDILDRFASSQHAMAGWAWGSDDYYSERLPQVMERIVHHKVVDPEFVFDELYVEDVRSAKTGGSSPTPRVGAFWRISAITKSRRLGDRRQLEGKLKKTLLCYRIVL